jgi:DNA-binding HxlR family transcriptional regulator
MDKKNEDSIHDQKIDEILEKHKKLDDICIEIFFTLQAYKRLRFNELHRYLQMFGTDISKQSLIEHLNHLRRQKLISRKKEGFQNVTYGLTDEINSLLTIPEENIKEWIEDLIEGKKLSKELKLLKDFDLKDYYSRLSEKQLDEAIDKDLNTIMAQNLFELKTFVEYDLKLDKPVSHAVFWNFVGNPLYRMLERSIVEDCRQSEAYRKKLFEKIDVLIGKIRPDRELLKEREERKKRQATEKSKAMSSET